MRVHLYPDLYTCVVFTFMHTHTEQAHVIAALDRSMCDLQMVYHEDIFTYTHAQTHTHTCTRNRHV